MHDRAEDCVKVIRHNLAFREMAATTPSTNLVRHLYLARHFPRQKVVKINEYQCPQAIETGRLFEIHPAHDSGDPRWFQVLVRSARIIGLVGWELMWTDVVMVGEIGAEVGIGRSFLGWTRKSFSDRSEELWETFEDFRWEIVACDWNNEWNEWV